VNLPLQNNGTIHIQNRSDWDSLAEFDLYLSTFDCSERVQYNFNNVKAKQKHWFLTPHHKTV
jgi:hypothetical protein